MNLEKIIYWIFGNNLVIGKNMRQQLAFLRENVPVEFKYQQMDDLGCGDGKITIMLSDILKPINLRGFDVHEGLVQRAKNRGIDAHVQDLEKNMPRGQLGVLWGVLHHLQDKSACLAKAKNRYQRLLVREPFQLNSIKGLELGSPLGREELEKFMNRHLPSAPRLYCNNSMYIFYTSPKLKK